MRLPVVKSVLALALVIAGCRSRGLKLESDLEIRAKACGLQQPFIDQMVQALVVPPVGWKAEPLKSSARHTHQVWISPTGNTAYGVIYTTLPLPLGTELTLWGFLQEMRRVEGRADLISKESDVKLPGVRFVAQGGLYTIRTNLIVSGFNAWAVYAGTLNGRPVDEEELNLARCARELTSVGPP